MSEDNSNHDDLASLVKQLLELEQRREQVRAERLEQMTNKLQFEFPKITDNMFEDLGKVQATPTDEYERLREEAEVAKREYREFQQAVIAELKKQTEILESIRVRLVGD